MRFENQVVVVTGGGQGIGACIARAYAEEGAHVVIAELDEEAGKENEAFIHQKHQKCIFIPTDVSKEESIHTLFSQIAHLYEKVDIVINNAGVSSGGSLFTRSIDEWNRVLGINLTGPYLCARSAVPLMGKQGGSIINIGSTRALMSEPHTEPYSASKGGLLALTHALAASLGPTIRVNTISPGWIDISQWKKQKQRKTMYLSEIDHMQHLVGRVGKPEDIATACLFLSSKEAGFITGVNLVIDGGMTVKMIYADE